MNKTEILNIVNEPTKHIQLVKIDGKDSIVYSSKFVELLELIPTILTKADTVAILDKVRAEIVDLEEGISSYHNDRPWVYKDEVLEIINKYKVKSEET